MLTRTLLLAALLFLVSACDTTTAPEHLSRAQEHVRDHNLSIAVIELKNAIQKDPKLAEARSLLAEIHLEQGDLPSAEKEIKRAIELGLAGEHEQLILLRTKLKFGRFDEIIAELGDLSGLKPAYAVVLGEAYLGDQQLERATSLISQGLDLPEGLVAMATIAQLQRDPSLALDYATQSVELNPRFGSGWLKKAEIELLSGDYTAALASFEAARSLPGASLLSGMGIVRTHLASEDVAAARTAVDKLLKSAQNYPPSHYLAGLVAYHENNLESAESALRTVQSSIPDHAPSLYLLGVVKARQGQHNQAISNLRKFLNAQPYNTSARKVLASVYAQMNDYEQVRDLLTGSAPQSNDPQIWAMLGGALMHLGDMTGATNAYQEAVTMAPDMAIFRNQLAISLLSSGERAKALSQLESAVELDGDQFQSDFILAQYKISSGDLEGARPAVTDLVAKSPANPIGHNLFGVLELRSNNPEAAAHHFSRALEIDANYFPARNYLAQLAEGAGNQKQAREIYQQGIATNGGSEAAQLGFVDYLVRQGNTAEALSLLDRAVTEYPNSVGARLGQIRLFMATRQYSAARSVMPELSKLAADVIDVLVIEAQLLVSAGNTAAAKTVVAKLQSKAGEFSGNPQYLGTLGELQYAVGETNLARRNLEAALKSPNPATDTRVTLTRLDLRENKTSAAEAHLHAFASANITNEAIEELRGEVLLRKGERTTALAHFKEMAESGSRAGTIRYALLVRQDGHLDESKRILKNWLSENPTDGAAKLILANIEVDTGNTTGARQHYESLMPTQNPVVLNNLAWIYFADGDSRAEDIARQAYTLQPQSPDIADTLGWILVNANKISEGLSLLKSSAAARPSNGEVQYHLAVAHHLANDETSAKATLLKALESSGEFASREQAELLLKQLQQP